jgi:hypothetical protein
MITLLMLLADSVIAPGSGAAMCRVLAPADFVRVGVPVTKLQPPGVEDDGASVYCTYANGTGKVEVDVFYPAADSPANVAKVETVTIQNTQGRYESTKIAGADDAQIGTVGSGASASALLVIRRGAAVIMIGVPAAKNARDQLMALARTAIGRFK